MTSQFMASLSFQTNQVRQSSTCISFWLATSNLLVHSDGYCFTAHPEPNHSLLTLILVDWSKPLFSSCLDYCKSSQHVSLLLPLLPFSNNEDSRGFCWEISDALHLTQGKSQTIYKAYRIWLIVTLDATSSKSQLCSLYSTHIDHHFAPFWMC